MLEHISDQTFSLLTSTPEDSKEFLHVAQID